MKLAFYIHIPYCSKRCGYCDFNTYTPSELKITSGLNEISGAYIDLAKNKIGQEITVGSIFFGGGTPSLMQPLDIGKVINKIKSDFHLADSAEITLEANPDSVDKDKLSQFLDVGIIDSHLECNLQYRMC